MRCGSCSCGTLPYSLIAAGDREPAYGSPASCYLEIISGITSYDRISSFRV